MGGQALHILKLDAQMGAKAPIWLDVRTSRSGFEPQSELKINTAELEHLTSELKPET